jgi:hypothetical protein
LSNVKFECGCDACYIAELTVKLREAEQDAKRYQWIREHNEEFDLDQAIDKAIRDRAIGNTTE